MEAVPIFDWLRWVEVPIWLGMVGWLWCHAKHDHEVEVELRSGIGEALGKLENVEANTSLILDKIIPDRKDVE